MKKLIILSLLIVCLQYTVSAQDTLGIAPSDTIVNSKNFIKFNITSALIKNYSLQYERILSRSISIALNFRMMPETGIPYTDNIFRWFDITDPDDTGYYRKPIIGNYAITPEIRFYTGKKRYGNGFLFRILLQVWAIIR